MTAASVRPAVALRRPLTAALLVAAAALAGGCASYQRPFVDASGWQPGCEQSGVGLIGMRAAAEAHRICIRTLENARFVEAANAGSTGITALYVDRGRVVVGAVQPDSPADQAGIGAGDLLLAVDAAPVRDAPLAQRLLFGRAGTPVALSLKQKDELHEVTVTRAPVLPPVVSAK